MPDSKTREPKVLLIGWDAADWRVIDPLLAQGKMPNLARFLQQGVRGNIATLHPPLSPMLWTSIATGKRAYKHGIHGFTEPTPDGRGVRPITNLARTTKAVWNILHQAGKTSNVVGWWPSHPAEPIRGVMVSNDYQKIAGGLDQPWPMPEGTVHPPRLAVPLSEFRLHPAELNYTHISAFVPRFGEIDQEKDPRLEALARTIAEVTSIQGAATALMQLEPWDFMAVYYDGIDHFGHGFMRYHPPQQAEVDDGEFALYSGVIEAAYRYHDMMLGALLALAGDDTTVIIMSDHGFHPDQNRPKHIPLEPAGPAVEHRQFGILALKGPGIRRGERIFGSSILDICPTILHLFGLPVGRDMDGKVLATAFREPCEVPVIPTWDDVPGDAGRHPAERELDPVAAAETMRQLIDLGYVEPLGTDAEKSVRQTVRELRYNLAQSYMGGLRFADATPILDELWEAWPDEKRIGISLSFCLAALGKASRRRAVLERLEKSIHQNAKLAAAALEPYRNRDGDILLEGLSEADQHTVRRLAFVALPDLGQLRYLWALQHLLEGRTREAVAALEEGASSSALSPDLQVRLGYGLLRLGERERAETCFRTALAQDPEEVEAHLGLAETRGAFYDFAGMLEAALAATELIFYSPRGHALVGTALLKLKQYDDAERAFELALHQNPSQRAARRGLTSLYKDLRPDPRKLAAHQQRITRLRLQARPSPTRTAGDVAAVSPKVSGRSGVRTEFPAGVSPGAVVTIVSGLPRSGTSMMMQMLAAGGIDPYTDGQRTPDIDNLHGYFEHEQATRLASDARWLPEARGKAVKIVAPLLPRLPGTEYYRIVLMHRDIGEVIASQRAMLLRLGRTGGALEDDAMAASLTQAMERVAHWCSENSRVQVLNLDYGDALRDPDSACHRLAEFLGRPLDLAAMRSVVFPALQRQRSGTVFPVR
ncbi:MAG: alkaline phosphatase family protein [Cytophagales bacterium]|nr:alkaline phosphatase family protein [Armatimonadota bacterium]